MKPYVTCSAAEKANGWWVGLVKVYDGTGLSVQVYTDQPTPCRSTAADHAKQVGRFIEACVCGDDALRGEVARLRKAIATLIGEP
jgi:hypothetical protein